MILLIILARESYKMRIKKAKLKQIIQEELQKLSEQSPGRAPGRARGNDPARLQRIKDKAAKEPETFVGKPDLAANQAELAAIEDEQRRKRDELYDLTMSDEQDIDYGGDDIPPDFTGDLTAAEIEAQGGASWEGEEEPSGEVQAPASAPAGRPKARVASGQMRKNINKAWKAGLFGPYEGGKKGTASRKVWRDARRALYKSTDSAAAILAAAGVDANTGGALAVTAAPSADPTVGIQPSPGPASGGAAPDVAGAPPPAVAKSASRQLGPGVGDLERDMLKLKKGLVTSELSQSGQERYQALRNTFLDQGEEPREASMKARRRLKSQIANRVTKRSAQRRLAKQYFERFKNQGLDDSEAVQLANSALKGRGEPLNTPPALRGDTGVTRALTNVRGGGRPGQFEESLDRLTKIVEEEFDKVLAEKEKKTTVSGDVPTHTIDYEEKDGYMHAIATTKDGIVGKGKAKIRSNRKDMARTAASVRARVALVKAAKKKAAGGKGESGDN
jgi:hypothetical protein